MTRKILLSGLVLLPFYEFIIYLLMPAGKIPEWIDLRVTKEYIAIGLALILTACAWQQIKKIECPNKWALFFLIFLFLNLSKTPIGVVTPVVDVSLLGNFSAEFKVFSFFLMFCTLASCRFSIEFFDEVLFLIFISAVAMAGYMVAQTLNLDQIYKPKPEYFNTDVSALKTAGFFGQPTLAVPFLVMAIPFAIYFRKAWGVVILSIAALLTRSDFAIASLVALFVLYSIGNKKMMAASVLILIACVVAYFLKPYGMFNDNARFPVWIQILKDVFSGEINGVEVRIGLFGAGLNNFGELFTALHNSAYTRAHNEFLQVLWCCGIIGEYIFLMINYDVFKTAFETIKDDRMKALLFSLITIVVCSMGTFVWQLGVYQFFTVLIVALIYQVRNKSMEKINV